MKESYGVRFWNKANECMIISGKNIHYFDTWKDAWNAANAMLKYAHSQGAVEVDINNKFFDIIDD